jgi:hypothetical protein
MARTSTKKQMRADRIAAVYESMGEERCAAIDMQIDDIAFGFDAVLESAVEGAADNATDDFENLLAEGYAEDEIEAVLTYRNCGRFEFFSYRDVRSVWPRHWHPQSERKLRGIPIRKEKTA